jgi:hypothetical protein
MTWKNQDLKNRSVLKKERLPFRDLFCPERISFLVFYFIFFLSMWILTGRSQPRVHPVFPTSSIPTVHEPVGGVPDGGVPDGGVPFLIIPSGGVPDGGVPFIIIPDGGVPEGAAD